MKNYIIRQNNNNIWHFCYRKNQGVCYRYKNNGVWSRYQSLYKQANGDFSVITDVNDNMHLICSDNNGAVIYLLFKDNAWHTFSLLSENDTGVLLSEFKLVNSAKRLTLFYVTQYQEKKLLMFYPLVNDAKPVTIDIIKNDADSFFVSLADEEMYIYFVRQDGKLGYKKYNTTTNTITSFFAISDGTMPSAYIDKELNEQLVYLQNNSIFYTRKKRDDSSFSTPSLIATGKNISRPVFFFDNDKLWIVWLDSNVIYYSISTDGGVNWKTPVKFLPSDTKSSIFCLQTPNTTCDCYGYISDKDIHLFVISNIFSSSNTKNANIAKVPTKAIQPVSQKKDNDFLKDYRVVGSDVEDFAKSSMNDEFVSTNEIKEDAETKHLNLDLQKLRIMIELIRQELNSVKTQLGQLSKNQEKINANMMNMYKIMSEEFFERNNFVESDEEKDNVFVFEEDDGNDEITD